jgi:type IV pilus assembly protein PilQ
MLKLKPYYNIYFILVFLTCFYVPQIPAQDTVDSIQQSHLDTGNTRYNGLKAKLDSFSGEIPALNERISVAVTDMPLSKFLYGDAVVGKLNLHIAFEEEFNISINISNARMKDILLLICLKFNLDIELIGDILSIKLAEGIKKTAGTGERPDISYNPEKELYTVDLTEDGLLSVSRELIRISGKNILVPKVLKQQKVSCYFVNQPLDKLLEMIAKANQLDIKKEDGYYMFMVEPQQQTTKTAALPAVRTSQRNRMNSKQPSGTMNYNIKPSGRIDIFTENMPIHDIIKEISPKMNINYLMLSDISGDVTLEAEDITFDNLMDYIFRGSDFSYKPEGDVYLFGRDTLEDIKNFEIIPLKYRTVDTVLNLLPKALKEELSIAEFPELNSIVVNGPENKIKNVYQAIEALDKSIPVVLIEVIIVESSDSHTITTGIDAGYGENQGKTTGSLFPGTDLHLGTKAINDLINSFNGFGWTNIGYVTPEFYLSIKALEDQGIIRIKSTPKLATLNSHSAELTSGVKKYYYKETRSFAATQSIYESKFREWEPVTADLSVKITPKVSGDDQITLGIEVGQSDFTPREFEGAPPGSINRSFKSYIRVKNQEMILLGGLEKSQSNDTGKSLPLLGRIPVLKWIFSSRTKSDSNSKLNIFIKPTIIN